MQTLAHIGTVLHPFCSWWDRACPGRNCSQPGVVNPQDLFVALKQYHNSIAVPFGIYQVDVRASTAARTTALQATTEESLPPKALLFFLLSFYPA